METQDNTQIIRRSQSDCSIAFRMMVVDEVEKGQLSYKQVQRKYGIKGRTTVLVCGNLDWKTLNPMAGKQTPVGKIKALEMKIKRLEAGKYILNLATYKINPDDSGGVYLISNR